MGDALGTTLEFRTPGTFEPLTDIVGGGPFELEPGQWTDDTSMALCLADSLVELGIFSAKDQMDRYVRWWQDGYLSSTGHCFDIGTTIRGSLTRYVTYGEPYSGDPSPKAAGNGSIMRLAPVPLFYAQSPDKAIERAAESSRTTHGAITCIDACRYMAAILVGAVQGASKETLLEALYSPISSYWTLHPLCPEIEAIAEGSFKRKQPPEIKGTGYVVDSLEAALWAFYSTSSFKEGCLKAVNLGNDADTTGAVYGQIAGVYYGVEGIPASWREEVAMSEKILGFSKELLRLAQAISI